MLWTVKQAGEFLNISPSMVYKMVSQNKLACVRLGESIRFIPETVENLLRNNKTEFERTAEYNNELKNANFNSQYMV
jgi:excisionase family DNA binding protein